MCIRVRFFYFSKGQFGCLLLESQQAGTTTLIEKSNKKQRGHLTASNIHYTYQKIGEKEEENKLITYFKAFSPKSTISLLLKYIYPCFRKISRVRRLQVACSARQTSTTSPRIIKIPTSTPNQATSFYLQ